MSKADHRDRYAIFVRLLRQARLTNGLTQTQVAERLGRPQSFVAKYEGCERILDVIDFLDVTAALDISWKDILNEAVHLLDESKKVSN